MKRTEDVYDRIDLEEDVSGLSFSADAKYLVSSTETMIRLWNPLTGERLRTIRASHDPAYTPFHDVACANKSPLCAVASGRGLDVWDLTSEEDTPQYALRRSDVRLSTISWSPDDALLLADQLERLTRGAIVWDYANDTGDRSLLELENPDNPSSVTRCIFSK